MQLAEPHVNALEAGTPQVDKLATSVLQNVPYSRLGLSPNITVAHTKHLVS